MNSNNNLVFESQDTVSSDPWHNPQINSNNLQENDKTPDYPRTQSDIAEEIDTYLSEKGYTLDTDQSVCAEYAEYKRLTARSSFRHDGYSKGGLVTKYSEGNYRHKDGYRKLIWAKLQCLNDWYAANPTEITMATFTVYQKDLEFWEMLDLLKSGFNKSKKILNIYLGKFSYIWSLDYQQTGAPHIHMLIFKAVPVELQNKLQDLWVNRYNVGASIPGSRCEQSLQFEISSGEQHLKSAVAYSFAYTATSLKSAQADPANFLLSAWLWKTSRKKSEYTGCRLWDSSQDLKKVMALADKNSDVIWWRSNVNIPASSKSKGGLLTIWRSEDMDGHSDIVKEFDEALKNGEVTVIGKSCN